MTNLHILRHADNCYQQCLPSPLTDAEFDRMANDAGFKGLADSEFPSLDSAIDEDGLDRFLARIPERDWYVYLELKVDGVSVIIEGDKMRSRKLSLDPILAGLNVPYSASRVSGELWHPRGRNYASGRIRANDAEAGLQFMPFCHSLAHSSLLQDRGYSVSPWCAVTTSKTEIMRFWDRWKDGQLSPEIPSDGIVVKCAHAALRERLGSTKRAPMWAIALKRAG